MLSIVGIGIIIFGNQVSNEAANGEARVSQAEANEQGQGRPIIGPIRRRARAQASENAQANISAAEQRIGQSQVTANWLHGVGIVIFALGVGSLIYCFSHKRRE